MEECLGRSGRDSVLLTSIVTDPSSLLGFSWNRSLLKWQMIWTSRQEMQGPRPPSPCSAQHYVRMALWCSKAGRVRSSRCLLRRLASMAMPRLDSPPSCLPCSSHIPRALHNELLILVLAPFAVVVLLFSTQLFAPIQSNCTQFLS